MSLHYCDLTHHMQSRPPIIITNIKIHTGQVPRLQYINLIISGKGAHFQSRVHGSGPQMSPELSEEQNSLLIGATNGVM